MQRKANDEMLSLIHRAEGGAATEIERGAIVFVFSRDCEPLRQPESYATQGIEPKARVGTGS